MAKGLSSAGKKAICRFLALFAAAAVLEGMTLLCFMLEGQKGVLLFVLCSYVLMPLAAILVPLWAALGGVHPLAACLPIGGIPLIVYSAEPKICFICIVVSLISAVAGQEWQKRKKG